MVSPSGVEEPVVREYDWTADSPCFAVIDAIARYEGAEAPRVAEQLTPALQDTLDVDALDTLFGNDLGLTVSFAYAGYYVQLTEETVAISQPTPANN